MSKKNNLNSKSIDDIINNLTNSATTNLIIKQFNSLFVWFEKNKRDLPWRKPISKKSSKRNPYCVWISEIMLQQTRVSVVIDYYFRWMKKYPNIKSLAKAKEEEVLLMWQGLGYYSRAKNILATAKDIFKDYNGIFPKKYSEIIKLKGIGEYTAGAICSIAYEQPQVLVDGNVERVIARLLCIKLEVKEIRKQKLIWKILEEVITKVPPQIFNEALMELGATVCIPKNPKCEQCPLQKNCLACQKNQQKQIPYKESQQKIMNVFSSCFLIIDSLKQLSQHPSILLEKRTTDNRLNQFWQIPTIEHHVEELNFEDLKEIFFEKYLEEMQNQKIRQKDSNDYFVIKKIDIEKFKKQIIHFYTKYKIYLNSYSTKIDIKKISKNKLLKSKKFIFVPLKDIDKIPITTATKKILNGINQY